MIHPTYLTVPKQYKGAMTDLFIESFLENLFSKFKPKQSYDKMVEAFRKRYETRDLYSKYVDGTTDWYLAPLDHCRADLTELSKTEDVLALDLGCGPASVCYWLRDNGYEWFYVGVDVIQEAEHYIKPLSNASFLQKKIENLSKDDFERQPDIIFAVNALCYVPDIEDTLNNLHKLSKRETQLMIIEPCHSSFWNKNSIAKRYNTMEMNDILHRTGWIPSRTFHLSVHKIVNKPIMNLSHSFLCAKKPIKHHQ